MTSSEIIIQFGNNLLVDMTKAIPKATGATQDSMAIRFFGSTRETTGFAISGGEQIDAIIEGRGPTSAGAKKGTPTLQEKMLEYIKALRIRPINPDMSVESLSWAFATHIHKNGFKGHGNIFGTILTKQRFDSLTKTILQSEALNIQSSLRKELKLS